MASSDIPGKLIIISGPVGAGKPAVARELVASANGALVYIEGDTFWSHFMRTTERENQQMRFRAILRAMCAAAIAYAAVGFDTVLDFSIPPGYLEAVRKLVGSKDIKVDFAVIRPSEEVCKKRAASRQEGAIEDYAPYHDLYMAFNGIDEKHLVRDDSSSPVELAEIVRRGLDAQTFRFL